MLGPELKKAAQLARNYRLFPTEYSNTEREKLPPAKLCIMKMIKRANEEHFIIATNDKTLRHKCRVDKVPYLYIHKNQLIIEGVQNYKNHISKENQSELDKEVLELKKLKKEAGLNKKPQKSGKSGKPNPKKSKKKNPNPLSVKKPAAKAKDKRKEAKKSA